MRYYNRERMEHNARVAERRCEMISMIGEVSWNPHPRATRVRVSIPGRDGIPLSLKAHYDGFDRHLLCKGRVVEVRESHKHNRRCFMVNRVFDEVKKPTVVTIDFKGRMPTPADCGYGNQNWGGTSVKWPGAIIWKGNPVDKVNFYLNSNYFDHPKMKDILSRVFKFRPDEFSKTKRQGIGLTFICTTDQFARFLIEQSLNGITDGFMDLGAKMVFPKPQPDVYTHIARKARITRQQARLAALALGYSDPTEIMKRMDSETPGDDARQIDVSDR